MKNDLNKNNLAVNNLEDNITPDIHSSSDEYASRFLGEFGSFALDVQGRAVLSILEKHDDIKTLLDVGGGHGQLTPYLLEKNYNITIYGSHEVCKKRVEEYLKNDNCNFKVGSLVCLPFEDKAFDAVLCFRQICHLAKWEDCIRELSRVSKKIVIIDYPTYRSFNILNKLFFKLKKKVEENTRTFKIFFDREIKEEFFKNNFKINKRIPQFFMPLVFYRIIKKRVLCELSEKFFGVLGLRYLFGSPVIVEAIRKDDKRN
ncbi:MAG: class I SAM-dependent methyltransferase [Bdellovibrionota bacterium]